MRISIALPLSVLSLVLCLAFAACGNGNDNSTDTPSPSPSAAVSSEIGQKILDYATKWGLAKTKVSYAYNSTRGTLNVQAVVTYYQDGSDFRTDVARADGTVIGGVKGDTGYSCSTAGTGGICLASTRDEALSANAILFLHDLTDAAKATDLVATATKIEPAESQTLAGQQTECFRVEGPLGGIGGAAIWCFSPGGLLLYVGYANADQSFTASASKIEEPQSSDFDPPYRIAPNIVTETAAPTP